MFDADTSEKLKALEEEEEDVLQKKKDVLALHVEVDEEKECHCNIMIACVSLGKSLTKSKVSLYVGGHVFTALQESVPLV